MAVINSIDSRMRERIFTMWEEAGGDPHSAYRLWHKLRPMLREEGTTNMPLLGSTTVPPAKVKARIPA